MAKHRSDSGDFQPSDEAEEPTAHRDRHEHGGASAHPDDDELARRTERERVEAGLEDFDPNDVPAATDEPPAFDVTTTTEYEEAEAEVRREESAGELHPSTAKHPDPPTHYDRS